MLRLKEQTSWFLKREEGGVLIENILWIPILLALTLMVLDLSFIYMKYSFAQRYLQQGVRQYMVGQHKTCDEAEDWLNPNLQNFISSANAVCTPLGASALIVARLETRDMDLTGSASLIPNIRISLSSDGTYEYIPDDRNP